LISRRLRPIKKLIAGLLSLSFLAVGAFVSGRQGKADPLERLQRLYEDRRYFELDEALAGMKSGTSPGLVFFRAAAANASNQLDEAASGLLEYLRGGSPDSPRPMAKEAWILLADTHRRAGRYKEAGEAYRLILERFGSGLEAEDKTNYESQSILWPALADVPPQTVEVLRDLIIPMEKRSFPVIIKGKPIYAWYDTGASLSVLYESAARELGFSLRGSGTKIHSPAGRWLENQVTVVPELHLGEAVVRNAVFLVAPDGLFPVREVRPGVERRALIGAPILTALKEIVETKDERLLIPAAPRPRAFRNLRFHGFMPIVEVFHRGERLALCVDTGSDRTFLYPRFFHRYEDDIRSRSKLRKVMMGAVGGSRQVAVHVLDEFAFRVLALDISLPKIMVHTEESNDQSERFDGVLGRDVLTRCSRMIINFESMSFILE